MRERDIERNTARLVVLFIFQTEYWFKRNILDPADGADSAAINSMRPNRIYGYRLLDSSIDGDLSCVEIKTS